MVTFNVDAGLWIAINRKRLGLEQKTLAQMVGISAQYMSDIEAGRRTLNRPELIQQIAIALNVSADPIFFAAGLLPPDINGEYPIENIVKAFDAMRKELK